MAKAIPLVLIMILSSLLNACASSVRTGRVPEEGLTVSQIYNQVIDDNAMDEVRTLKGQRRASAQIHKTHYEGAFHQAFMNVSHGFKALNNPAIPIYITPKVALVGDEQLVKPGFVTQFYLFKKNQFALNSETF